MYYKTPMKRPPLTLFLAAPRGFCAGVDRAVEIVEKALLRFGSPVYVRHEIVHNRFVLEQLKAKGAVFVEELDEVPDGSTVIFSAHGVPKSVPDEARRRGLRYIDATCPLVSKVHKEAEFHHRQGRHILLIGHAGHPEVVGTMGQLPTGSVTLVETVADAMGVVIPPGVDVAYATQTTLAVDDTAEIVAALKTRFPSLPDPRKEDICYATTNRQAAVRAIAPRSDAVLVIGSANSSNSCRLAEVAVREGCPQAQLIDSAADIDWQKLEGIATLGLTAGASAPEVLVAEVISALKDRFELQIETVTITQEDIVFNIPRLLSA